MATQAIHPAVDPLGHVRHGAPRYAAPDVGGDSCASSLRRWTTNQFINLLSLKNKEAKISLGYH